MKNIPLNRLILYIIILGMVPIGALLFRNYSSAKKLNFLIMRTETTASDLWSRESRQKVNKALQAQHQEADHFYLFKYLENLVFLEDEIGALHKIINSDTVSNTNPAKKRLDHLTSSANQMIFKETAVKTSPPLKETIESLAHPVEISLNDLARILTRIEGIPIADFTPPENIPHLIVTDFILDKKEPRDNHEVYELIIKLLKREFI